MTMEKGEQSHEHGKASPIGILITNLGTPDAPTSSALRKYLGEFLWDSRVVEIPRPVWWLILHGFVLPFRPRRSAKNYLRIWDNEGSPLLLTAQKQAAALQAYLNNQFPGPVITALGMRYGNPSIESALEKLREANVQRLLVFPLYPQYSAATTASTFDAVAAVFNKWRRIPEMRMINQYHDDPDYIGALARSIREHWQRHGREGRLLMSFHGMPKRTLLAGDPYYCQCQKTGRLIAERLELADDEWFVSFQSRFGREEWLQPYTDKTLKKWAKEGVKRVDVISPGFSADCVETLEELDLENREVFMAAGGEEYFYIPALNERDDHIRALGELVLRHTQGWPGSGDEWDGEEAAQARELGRQRALKQGAKG